VDAIDFYTAAIDRLSRDVSKPSMHTVYSEIS
jgi:hypothetical protein